MARTVRVIDKIVYGNEQFVFSGTGGGGGGISYQAGTGLTLTNAVFNHSNSVTAQNSQAIYPIKIDAQGHISGYGTAVVPLTATSTLDATKVSGTLPASTYSDTKVTQNVISGNDTNSYPLLLSASTDGTTATTETTLKSSSLTFIRDDDGANSLKIGNGRVILGRVNYNSNETTRSAGTGIGIGTGDTSDSEMYYRTAGSGQFVMQHWTAAKKSDTTPADGSYRDSIITMSTSAGNPTIYLYNKSAADTIVSYSRLNSAGLYINNGTAHNFNAVGIDKVNALGTQLGTTISSSIDLDATTWTTLTSVSLPVAGTYLLVCYGQFPSTTTDAATRLLRLCTTNTGNTSVSGRLTEVTMRPHSNSQNHCNFTYIATVSEATTYYLRGWSSIAASACYGAYQRVRLF